MMVNMRRAVFFLAISAFAAAVTTPDLEKARDQQDRAALQRIVDELSALAQKQPNDANAQYRVAMANSFLAEVAIEVRDKAATKPVTENGIRAAEKAVSLKGDSAE